MIWITLLIALVSGSADRCERVVDLMLRSERLTGAALELSGACQSPDPGAEIMRLAVENVELAKEWGRFVRGER